MADLIWISACAVQVNCKIAICWQKKVWFGERRAFETFFRLAGLSFDKEVGAKRVDMTEP